MKKIIMMLLFVIIISSVSFAVTIPAEDIDYFYEECTYRICPATFIKDFHYEDKTQVIDFKTGEIIFVIKEQINSSNEFEENGAVVFVYKPTTKEIQKNKNGMYKEYLKILNTKEFILTCGVTAKKYIVSKKEGARLFQYPYTSSKLLKTLSQGTEIWNGNGELYYNFYDKKYMDESDNIYRGFDGQEFWVYTGEGFVSSKDLTSTSDVEFKEILKAEGIVSKDFSRDGLEIPANTIITRVVLKSEDGPYKDYVITKYYYDGKYLTDKDAENLDFTIIENAKLAKNSSTGEYFLLNDNQMQYYGQIISNRLIVDTAEIGVFKQADYNSDIIGVLHRSDAVDIKYYDNDDFKWICIDYNGAPGYVPTENMTLVDNQLYIYIPGETPTKNQAQTSGDSGEVVIPDEPEKDTVEPDVPLPKEKNQVDPSVIIKGMLVISFFIVLFFITQITKKPR